MRQTGQSAIVALAALLSWLMLRQLIIDDVGGRSAFDPLRLVFYLLLIAAPMLTFVPISNWLRAPLFEVESVASWATLGFVVAVVTPNNPPSLGQFLVLLLPLTVALATVMTLVSFLAGLRVYRGDPRRYDIIRARRQGYLASFMIIASMLLYSIGTLSPTSATMLLGIAILAEMFSLTRDGQRFRGSASRVASRT